MRPSYLYNENPYTGNTSLYWNGSQLSQLENKMQQHNFPSGLQTIYHYISAWISETPLTFMLELVVSFISVVCIILCTNLP